jgi:RNA polymerase sigma-70 factor (ECF subfamily)
LFRHVVIATTFAAWWGSEERARPARGARERHVTADRFEAFVEEYQDMVYGTAVRLLGNPADAEDMAQTVFLKAFERFDEIGTSPAAPGWLKTVTTNLCLNHLSRYRSRWRFFSELGAADQDDSEHAKHVDALIARGGAAGTATVEAELMSAADAERLEQALHALPDHQRVPIVLFHFEDKSYVEIASLLGVSLAKVKTDIHRGREALRRVLQASHAS